MVRSNFESNLLEMNQDNMREFSLRWCWSICFSLVWKFWTDSVPNGSKIFGLNWYRIVRKLTNNSTNSVQTQTVWNPDHYKLNFGPAEMASHYCCGLLLQGELWCHFMQMNCVCRHLLHKPMEHCVSRSQVPGIDYFPNIQRFQPTILHGAAESPETVPKLNSGLKWLKGSNMVKCLCIAKLYCLIFFYFAVT